MNYEWLFAFTVFADHMNFTRAANQIHISQPALHVQIRKLSESVGCPLYRRKGRALVLTEEGKRLAAFGREVQERGLSVLGELRGGSVAGPLVLASGYGAFLYLLGPAIRRFPKKQWPLRLVAMQGPESIEAVRDAKAHLCVVATDHPPADLKALRLRSVGQRAILPATHRLARRRSIRAHDLAGEPLVVAPGGSPHRIMVEQALSTAGAEWTVAVEANGWELMLQFAKYGLGIAVVNDFCPPPSGMVAVPLIGVPQITYHLIERTALFHDGVETMRKLIAEAV